MHLLFSATAVKDAILLIAAYDRVKGTRCCLCVPADWVKVPGVACVYQLTGLRYPVLPVCASWLGQGTRCCLCVSADWVKVPDVASWLCYISSDVVIKYINKYLNIYVSTFPTILQYLIAARV